MRQSILVILVFIGAISLNAQKKLTLNANVGAGLYGFAKSTASNFSIPSLKETLKYPARPGGYIGLEMAYVNPKWQFLIGATYQYFQTNLSIDYRYTDEMGVVFFEASTSKDINLHALQIPLQCSFKGLDKKNKLSIDFGFIISWLKEGSYSGYQVDPNRERIDIDFIPFTENLEFLVSTGFTYKAFDKLSFSIII